MIKLKLIKGLSHENGYVRATQDSPLVEVETEEIAAYCVESGYFEKVNDQPKQQAAAQPEKPKPTDSSKGTKPTDVNHATDELNGMTAAELRAYAETVGIDLGKATKRADIIAVIRKAEENA